MQIGKYYPPHKGGFETHLELLVKGLLPHFDVQVIVSGKSSKTTQTEEEGVEVLRLATPFHLAGAPILPALTKIVRASSGDLIHLHHPNPYAMIALSRFQGAAPIVLSYHSDVVRQKVLGTVFQPILKKFLARCSRIIVSSEQLLKESESLRPFHDKCVVVPWGIDAKSFETSDPHAVKRIQNQYGPRIVLAVGRLVYYKGFDYLIRAMEKVNGRLLMIGEGPLKQKLTALAKRTAKGKVIFLGEIGDDEIVNYYHAADVFVLPSIAQSEAFGIVQLEAMASGTPVINTQLPTGVPFVSLHQVTGLTVPPRDEDALASAMNLLLTDRGLGASYGEQGKQRVQKCFSAERMVNQTIQVYENVLSVNSTQSAQREKDKFSL